jgi:hypothetical protein
MSQQEVLGRSVSDDTPVGDELDVDKFVQENIGEGRKYATPEDALKALVKKAAHQDTFIETLKLENQGTQRDVENLQAKLAEAKKLDDLMAALVGTGAAPDGDDDKPPAPANQVDLQKLVKDALNAEKAAEAEQLSRAQRQANQDKAFQLLAATEGFGSEANAKLAIRKYVGEDKARADLLNRMGESQPEAVAAFLKLQLKDDQTLPGTGDTRFNPGSEPVSRKEQLTWSKVKQIKKDNPALYKSRQFQMRIHAAAAANPNFLNE